jgi:WD40 repeat protein
MAEYKDSMGQISSRTSGLAGWLVVLAALGGVGFGVAAHTRPDTTQGAEEGPFAQAARGDHDGPIWSLAFAPGDAYLASATITGDLWIKDLASGRSRRLTDGPIGSSKSLAFSPDGRILAVAGRGAAVRQWAVDTGAELEPLTAIGTPASWIVALSPDGSLMAVGESEYDHLRPVLTLVDRAHGRSYVLDGHPEGVKVMAFSPDGRTLAAGDQTGLVKLWDVTTLRAQVTLWVNNPGAQSLVFSPDGSRLATWVSLEHAIQFWDAATGESRGEMPLDDSTVFAVAFSSDGKTMAVAGADGLATLWDVGEGRNLGSVGGRGRPLYAVAFSRDGRRIATGGADGHVCIWDVSEILGATSPHRS